MYRERYRAMEKRFVADADFAALGQHPLGAFVWGTGLLASAPGFIALLLLAAHLVAGEWSRRTVTPVLFYEQRLGRLLAARAAALWLWAAGTAMVISLGVWLLGVLHTRETYPLHGSVPFDDIASIVGQRVGVGVLVLGVFIPLAVVLAALVRQPLRTVLAGTLALALCAWSALGPLAAWLPGRLLADAMGYARHWATTDHWWLPAGEASMPVWVRLLPFLAVASGVFMAGVRRRRRDLV
jgi:hypothetical protein